MQLIKYESLQFSVAYNACGWLQLIIVEMTSSDFPSVRSIPKTLCCIRNQSFLAYTKESNQPVISSLFLHQDIDLQFVG